MSQLKINDESYLASIRKYCDLTNLNSTPHHLRLIPVSDKGTAASVNFVVPVKLPEYFYDTSAQPLGGDQILSRETFVEYLPDALHESISDKAINESLDIIIENMQGKERYIRTSNGGLFVASAVLLVLFVDETNTE